MWVISDTAGQNGQFDIAILLHASPPVWLILTIAHESPQMLLVKPPKNAEWSASQCSENEEGGGLGWVGGQERKLRYQKAGFDLAQLGNVKSSIFIPASFFSRQEISNQAAAHLTCQKDGKEGAEVSEHPKNLNLRLIANWIRWYILWARFFIVLHPALLCKKKQKQIFISLSNVLRLSVSKPIFFFIKQSRMQDYEEPCP